MATFLSKLSVHKHFSNAHLEWLSRGATILTFRRVFRLQRIVTRAVPIVLLLLVAGGQNRSLGEAVANEPDLKTQIFALQRADEITLMILPSDMAFFSPPSVEMLPQLACVYKIYDNEQGKALVISVLADNVIDDNEHVGEIYPEVGILFQQHSETISEFYFSILAEKGEIPGQFNRRRVKLHTDALTKIRALPAATNATLTHCWLDDVRPTLRR